MPVPIQPSSDTSQTGAESVQQQQDISSLEERESSSGKGGDLNKEEEDARQQKDLSRHSSKVGAFASDFLLVHVYLTTTELEITFAFYFFRCSNFTSFHSLHCPLFPSNSTQKKRNILSSDDEGSDDEREGGGGGGEGGGSSGGPTSAGGEATAEHSDDSVIIVPDSQVCFLFFTADLHKSLEQFINSSPSSFFVFTLLSHARRDTIFHLQRLPMSLLFLPSSLNSALSVSAAPQFTCQVRSGRFEWSGCHILSNIFSNTSVFKDSGQKRRLTKGSGSFSCFHSHFHVIAHHASCTVVFLSITTFIHRSHVTLISSNSLAIVSNFTHILFKFQFYLLLSNP